MSNLEILDNWRVVGNKLITITETDISVADQTFKEGVIVEVNADTVVKLGKPAPSRLHTTRLIRIFEMVLEDMDKTKDKIGGLIQDLDVFAYTSKNSTPNITIHDVEGMIKELNL